MKEKLCKLGIVIDYENRAHALHIIVVAMLFCGTGTSPRASTLSCLLDPFYLFIFFRQALLSGQVPSWA